MTYMFSDHLGSTVAIYNHLGYTYRNGYYPFLLQPKASECCAGDNRYSTSSNPNQFTGQRNESLIGLYDYHARFYDPAIGRIISADTIVPGPGSPQSWDRYAYVNNNPVRYSDPSGYSVDCSIGDVYCNAGKINVNQWALDIAEKGKSQRRTMGSALRWAGLGSQEKNIMKEAGWQEGVYEDHVFSKGVQKANYYEDPVFYITAIWGTGKIGTSIVGLLTESAAICESTNCSPRIGQTGDFGENYLKVLGGKHNKYFSTSEGGRYIDQYINEMAYESKVGYTSLSQFVSKQVAKDVELLTTDQVKSVTWVFFTSPVTNLRGPSINLYELLIQNGIEVLFGP